MQKSIFRNLPSLNALRAFEASARHLSFTRAAEELCVTQGAVSRQVKQLEETLGVTLFHRLHRQLILTDQGQMLTNPLIDAFDLIAASLDRLKNQPTDLKIKVHPTFAIRWLIPRLHRFQNKYPEIQVRLTTSSINVDFTRENFDVGIIYTGLIYNEEKRKVLGYEKIVDEYLTPVCSPELIKEKGGKKLKSPDDLVNYLLLHNNHEQREWRAWAKAVGVTDLLSERGQIFEVDDAALQAAASGLGIALGNLVLIKEDLESGRLVMPFKDLVVKTGEYYVTWPDINSKSKVVEAFRGWMLSEV
ncbi:Glycine cleavage system transcriptional activator [Desulfamplus magnetovallimortis]|uniref:Glycine cleavage system transcriptional activator n=1 Tax=Desulfamplus magnetovallimortis TaxID=1246637 RepID=A0A1W1H5A8_9BACT|nr:transcriptional regulator GcvA [Desulfamplus magnetovallimortis]SLM27632.1 Glycine cleavage system transcriptional activator [Desulfamplus magnetovallimortis]